MDSDRDMPSSGSPRHRRSEWHPVAAAATWTLAGIGLLSQAGCMSALTATTLREALRETAASLSTPHDLDHAAVARPREALPAEDAGSEEPTLPDDAELEKVIDNAVARLSAAGGIDPPTQQLLIETLERTRPEDWAVVVNEFATALEESRGSAAEAGAARPLAPPPIDRLEPADRASARADVADVVASPPAEAAAESPVAASLPAADPATLSPSSASPSAPAAPSPPAPLDISDVAVAALVPPPSTPVQPAVALIEPADAAPAASITVTTTAAAAPAPLPAVPVATAAAPAGLQDPPVPESFEAPAEVALVVAPPRPTGPAINNACFATRVRGWGNVERFPRTAFRPGQEVIVYFELDRLEIRSSPNGHTTGIDTAFRLLDGGGQRIGQWTFEPIVETCPSPRRDYFARYFLRIPEDAKPGQHRLEWLVTDTVAGATRQAHLDLDVMPNE